MDKTETTEAVAAIGMMLQAFPSAQSSITADSPRVYLFAVEDFSLEALKRACRLIVRGEIKDLKADFPPSAPKLAQVVKECEDRLMVERHEATHVFIEDGSVLWDKMRLLRKDPSLPAYERLLADGTRRRGWFFNPDEAEKAGRLELPPPMPEVEMAQRRADLARRMNIQVGDAEGDEAAA